MSYLLDWAVLVQRRRVNGFDSTIIYLRREIDPLALQPSKEWVQTKKITSDGNSFEQHSFDNTLETPMAEMLPRALSIAKGKIARLGCFLLAFLYIDSRQITHPNLTCLIATISTFNRCACLFDLFRGKWRGLAWWRGVLDLAGLDR